MALTIGTQLGSHEITALLGKGGMGEVYRARDLKLKREVAIKILPEEFSLDADRVNRFQREAEVLASLNHPNIAAIHDVAEANGSRYLVLELVEGDTLADRIARGPIPVQEGLNIAKQITEALEAAHERGIIHRDLKPANIKLTADGKVKVLDFGLAKAMESTPASATLSNSPTLLSGSMAGMIVGTAAYMSPEQAKGRAVDRRTDIFAFGCVLFEMLSGHRTFDAEDVSETLAAVLMKEPDWATLPATTPLRIIAVLRRCLKKDPKERARDIGDVWLAFEGAFDVPAPQTPPVQPAAKSVWRQPLAMAVYLLVAAVVASGWAFLRQPSFTPPVSRFSINLPQGKTLQSTGRQNLAISPDGRRIVYASDSRLFGRALADFEAREIPGTASAIQQALEGISSPAFSPDGRALVFFSPMDGTIKRISIEGGTAVTLCPAIPAVRPALGRKGNSLRPG
jgi:serine/threonine-protein kinase